MSFHPVVLSLSAALSLWLALHVQRRGRTPGTATFVWLLVAIATWCLTAALHWAANSLDAKVAWARVQYFAIASVPALSLMFACRFAGAASWLERPRNLFLFWTIPVLTVFAALTNAWHRALWSSITPTGGGLVVYEHGWWFWVATAHAYGLMLVSALLIARALWRSRPPYRAQFAALLAGALLPWAGNLLYIAGLIPIEGLDVTPLMFTLSGALFTNALYRDHLFDLVPVARDQLVDSLSDAVVVLDSSQRVLDLNAAAKRLAAGNRPLLVPRWFGEPLDELIPFLKGTSLTFGAAPTEHVVVETSSPCGESRCFDVCVTPVRTSDNRVIAWAVLLRDITEQRRTAMERKAFETRVQEQQKRESLSVLAGGLAHDFNNLLAGILGNADLLALKLRGQHQMTSHVGAIILGAQRGADLVSKMLAYAGERHGASEQVNLDALIREMLDLLEASVARHCTLRYEGEPVFIFADPVQIRQVVMNLIINAAEAVDEQTGTVTVSVGVERLSARDLDDVHFGEAAAPGNYAFLEVHDNGPGMDPSTLRRIFTPFYTTKATGHGLGLAAVQGIVRGHRGALRVDTRPGEGARFRVWFPVAAMTRAQSKLASPASPSLIS